LTAKLKRAGWNDEREFNALAHGITNAMLAASAAAGAHNAETGAPTTMPGAAVTATSGPPIITISGDNPATVTFGAIYADLGASITALQQELKLGLPLYYMEQPPPT
jgi:hypothetical protein